MSLFSIERELPGATSEDVDAAGYRAVACAFNYPGLRWISSYWDRAGERIFCIYEADSAEQIQHHSMRARIPCDRVSLVEHIDPARFTNSVPYYEPSS
jgi:hypothetical protein